MTKRGLAAVAILFLANSCGNKPTGNSPGTVVTSGTVTLPSGAPIALATLTVSTAGGTAAVASNGSFSVSEPSGGGPTTVTLTDSSGNLVMLGHVDTDNPGFNDISPTSTAEELLFLSTFSFALPPEQWPQVYTMLAAAPETATVAGVISAQIAVNPTAVGAQDAQIAQAVSAATQSLLTGAPGVSSLHAPKVRPADATAAGATSTQLLSVRVLDDNPPGLAVQASLDDLGIYVSNAYRVHRHYYVFRSGFVPSTGTTTDTPTPLQTWVPVADGFLPAVTGVAGVVNSLIDWWTGSVAWAPTSSGTIALPLDPPDAKENSFTVYVVGAGAPTTVPSDLAGQAAALASVNSGLSEVQMLEWFKEVVWPLFTKTVPPGAIGNAFGNPTGLASVATQLTQQLTSFGLNLEPYWLKGDFKTPTSALLDLVASNPQARNAVFNIIYNALIAAGPSGLKFSGTGWQVTGWFTKFGNVCAYINVLDKALAGADLGSVFYQISASSQYTEWGVTSTPPTVQLSPQQASVAAKGSATFTTNVGGGLNNLGALVYHYTCGSGQLTGSGGSGDILSDNGHDLYSLSPTVSYTPAAGAQNGDTDAVSVSVTIYGATNEDIGSATSTITISGSSIDGGVERCVGVCVDD